MLTLGLMTMNATRRHGLTAALAALVLAGTGLTGCSTGTDSGSAGSSASGTAGESGGNAQGFAIPDSMPEGKGSEQPDGAFPRTVAHFQGETTIDSAPKKVVVVSTGQADALLSLGIVPVGSTSGDGANVIPEYLTESFPEHTAALADVRDVGSRTDPDIETIANIDPDLILMNTAGKNADQLYSQLTAIAPTVATQGTGLHWKEDYLLLADAVGKREEAQTWLDTYEGEAKKFGEALGDTPTVSFLRRNGDRMRVFGESSFTGSVAADAGLRRPETQSFTDKTSQDIGAEQLEQADADWIFYGVQGGDDAALTGQPLWQTLGAVGAGQAVSVDDDVFYLNTGPTAARDVLDKLEDTLA